MFQEIKGIESLHGIRYPYFGFSCNFSNLKNHIYKLELVEFEFLKDYYPKDNKVELHLSCPKTFFYQIFNFEMVDNKLLKPVQMLVEGDKIDSKFIMFEVCFRNFQDQEWIMYETDFKFKLSLSNF